MSAATPVARQSPAGLWLDDGHSTKVTIGTDPDISFWEKTVTPPGLEGGDPIDTTNMHNTKRTTKAPQSLYDVTPTSGSASYDPAVLTQLIAQINNPTTITITFPDGSTWADYGYLRSFVPQENSKGSQPVANYTIEFIGTDTSGDEQDPAVASVAGT